MLDLEAYIEYFNGHDMFSIRNGIKLIELREGYSKAEVLIDENGMNYMGTMHGGFLYTLADVAAGSAVAAYGKECVTLSAYTDYVSAARAGKATAQCRVVHKGRTIARCEVIIRGEDGKVYIKSQVNMFVTNRDVIIPE